MNIEGRHENTHDGTFPHKMMFKRIYLYNLSIGRADPVPVAASGISLGIPEKPREESRQQQENHREGQWQKHHRQNCRRYRQKQL
jgi:hypothetical protein